MENLAPFTVYNASAGSGKTYTLVRDFLSILLQQKDVFYFRHVLAITFTNKASAEMKNRILDTLQCFAIESENDMMADLIQQTGLDALTISQRSKGILNAILEDYSRFNITTIDSFSHRIIRSFAYDFGLSSDFNIELDAKKLLQEAVDLLVSKIGIDVELTKVLIQFSLQKSDEDKAWDISKNLFDFAKILLNETDKKEFDSLSNRSIDDYRRLKNKLTAEEKALQKRMENIGESALIIIDQAGIKHSDFLRSSFPKHFEALAQNWQAAKFFDLNTLKSQIENQNFYPKNKPEKIKTQIDQIIPELVDLYYESEKLFSRLTLLKAWNGSIFPMSVLNYIQSALEQLKSDYNIQLISDFNEMIHHKIKGEPTPFIYERMGENFKHYFIDEMQDTSVLQWQNLVQLIENTLSQEGSLLLVGDAKQSIYRWRGSNPEQFIELSNPNSNVPFHIPKKVVHLDTNYRSFSEVIDFNNQFFEHISDVLQNETYEKLYLNDTFQKLNSQKGGYVQVEFLVKQREDDEKDLLYPKQILEIIQNLDQSFQWNDVCILVRTNKQGSDVAQYLIENEIDVLSSESLLLNQNPSVVFLINVLQMMQNPIHFDSKFNVLGFLHHHLQISTSKHLFFKEYLELSTAEFFNAFSRMGLKFDVTAFYQMTLYDSLEYLIRSFKLHQKSDVYLFYFLEWVLDFQTQKGSDLVAFLDYWELKNENLSISVPDGKMAVRIMTIHRAKGLQFPVVIFPYDLDIYKDLNSKEWYHFENPEEHEQFGKLLIPFRSELQYTDNEGVKIFNEHRQKQELDNFNILYVALTRAVEQLYILTDFGLNAKGEVKVNYYSGLFTRFLQQKAVWEPSILQYSFGDKKKFEKEKKTQKCGKIEPEMLVYDSFVSSDISNHSLKIHTQNSRLWDTEQGEAIKHGNLFHAIMAQIITPDDLNLVLDSFLGQGLIDEKEMKKLSVQLNNLMQHPSLEVFFETNQKVFCERELLTSDKQIIIPDRVVFFNENEMGILDYKTGIPTIEHKIQIDYYASVLEEMGWKVREKWLVYMGDEIVLR